jgi:hypothetical protein
MIDYENKTISELMAIYNPIYEQIEEVKHSDYNELFCEWIYDLIVGECDED